MKQNAVDLHHSGKSIPDIATTLGMSNADVWLALREAGIARLPHVTRAASKGENLADPFRADKLLRRF